MKGDWISFHFWVNLLCWEGKFIVCVYVCVLSVSSHHPELSFDHGVFDRRYLQTSSDTADCCTCSNWWDLIERKQLDKIMHFSTHSVCCTYMCFRGSLWGEITTEGLMAYLRDGQGPHWITRDYSRGHPALRELMTFWGTNNLLMKQRFPEAAQHQLRPELSFYDSAISKI